jgi:outer membrane receptor protein involved in Fe transport
MKITAFKTVFLILLMGLSQIAFSQTDGAGQGVGVIKGNLIDSLTGQPLEYVSIALKRGNFAKIINGTITDEKGNFRLEGVGVGIYKLTFSFIGYETKTIHNVEITVTNAECHIKNIILRPIATILKESVITSEKQLIEQHVDKIVYNVDKDVGASTQTLNDILRKVPMVSIDAEGTPSLRGNTNVRVLINGKPSGIFAANIADALGTIPANQVLRVEVLISASSKYDAEGTGGIINIITKKKQIEGYNGSVNVSAGFLMGNSSLNFNARTAKLGVNISLSNTALFPRTFINNVFHQDNIGDIRHSSEQKGTAKVRRYAEMAQLGFDYDFNSQNSLTTTFRLSQTGLLIAGMVNTVNTIVNKDTQITDLFVRDISNQKDDKNFDWTTDYKRIFKNPKNELNASIQWSHFKSDGNYFIDETIYPIKQRNIQEKGLNNGKTDELTGQIDITKALGKTATLEMGVKNIFRQIRSISEYMEYNDVKADYLKNGNRSDDFDYHQNVSALYAQTNFPFKNKWTIQIGSRLENTFIQSLDANKQRVNNNYLNLTPTIVAAYTFKNTANLRISYNRRIQRPGLAQLNPFINSADPRNLTQGNILLRPEIVDKFEMTYTYYFAKGFLYCGANYDLTKGLIERIITLNTQGVSLSTFQNIGIAQTIGSSVFASYQLKPIWTVRGGFNASTYYAKGSDATLDLTNRGIQLQSYIMSSISLKSGFSVEGMVNYNAPTYTIQGKTQDVCIMTLAAKMDVLKKKGTVSLTVLNPFWRNLTYSTTFSSADFEQSRSMIIPFRTVNLGFNYKFGKAGKISKGKKSVENTDLKKGEKENF